MEYYKEMGQRIKLRRKEMRMKQAELAERIDISNNHMSSIEYVYPYMPESECHAGLSSAWRDACL